MIECVSYVALLGYATTVIPRWFTYYASTFLFALFGLRMLREGWYMSADEGQEELEEVQADLKRRDEEVHVLFIYVFHFKTELCRRAIIREEV